MLNSKSIGNKITAARKKVNLSQTELAQQVSISPQAVGKWERGESMPDITTFNRLAEILGVDLNYFSENFQSTHAEAAANTIDDNPGIEQPAQEAASPGEERQLLTNFSGSSCATGCRSA